MGQRQGEETPTRQRDISPRRRILILNRPTTRCKRERPRISNQGAEQRAREKRGAGLRTPPHIVRLAAIASQPACTKHAKRYRLKGQAFRHRPSATLGWAVLRGVSLSPGGGYNFPQGGYNTRSVCRRRIAVPNTTRRSGCEPRW